MSVQEGHHPVSRLPNVRCGNTWWPSIVNLSTCLTSPLRSVWFILIPWGHCIFKTSLTNEVGAKKTDPQHLPRLMTIQKLGHDVMLGIHSGMHMAFVDGKANVSHLLMDRSNCTSSWACLVASCRFLHWEKHELQHELLTSPYSWLRHWLRLITSQDLFVPCATNSRNWWELLLKAKLTFCVGINVKHSELHLISSDRHRNIVSFPSIWRDPFF